MKKIIINYAILLCTLISASSLILNQPASTILKSVMYLSIPMLVALGTIYILIEHVVTQSRKHGDDKSINILNKKEVRLLRLI
jgi:ACR3 family arsenite efflux pump ArsB